MSIIIDDHDKKYYQIQGSKNIEKVFGVKKGDTSKYLIPKTTTIDKFLEKVYDVTDVSVTFDYRDYNNFLGETLLNNMFRLVYMRKGAYDDYEITSILDDVYVKLNKLPTSNQDYDEVIFTDKIFDVILQDFEDNMRRVHVKWHKFGDYVSKDRGSDDELKELVKNLFILNFASSVSKKYMRFVLKEFHDKIKRYYRVSGGSEDVINKTILDYISLKSNNKKKAQNIYKNMPVSNLGIIGYNDILGLLNDLDEDKEDDEKKRGQLLLRFLDSAKRSSKRLSRSDVANLGALGSLYLELDK
jgi:hypothetical protein